jgi:hypothetical protein
VSYRTNAEAVYASKEMVRMIDERFTRVERRFEERLSGMEDYHRRVVLPPDPQQDKARP